jgi:CBS domain containing-hemolysin-like protein
LVLLHRRISSEVQIEIVVTGWVFATLARVIRRAYAVGEISFFRKYTASAIQTILFIGMAEVVPHRAIVTTPSQVALAFNLVILVYTISMFSAEHIIAWVHVLFAIQASGIWKILHDFT